MADRCLNEYLFMFSITIDLILLFIHVVAGGGTSPIIRITCSDTSIFVDQATMKVSIVTTSHFYRMASNLFRGFTNTYGFSNCPLYIRLNY